MNIRLLSCLLLCLPFTGGCVAVAAGAAAGYIVSQEVLPNDVHTATIADDVDVVWRAAKETLRALSTEPPAITESPRIATGVVDGADVSVEVQAYDLDVTILRVHAERYMTSRGAVAKKVLEATIDRLPRR